MTLQLACYGTLADNSMEWSIGQTHLCMVHFHALAGECMILTLFYAKGWVTCKLSAYMKVCPQKRLQVGSCVTCILSVLTNMWPQD